MDKATSLKKRTLAVLLAILTVIAYMPMNTERAYAEGINHGDHVDWKLLTSSAGHPSDETLNTGKYIINQEYYCNVLTINGNVTICLNGGNLYPYMGIVINSGATLTIEDCNSNSGTITGLSQGKLFTVNGNGNLVMNGVTISGNNGTILDIAASGNAELNNTTISGNEVTDGNLIIVNNGGHLVINGGELNSNKIQEGSLFTAEGSRAVKLESTHIVNNGILMGSHIFSGNNSIEAPAYCISGDIIISGNNNYDKKCGADSVLNIVGSGLSENAHIDVTPNGYNPIACSANKDLLDVTKFFNVGDSVSPYDVICGYPQNYIALKPSHTWNLEQTQDKIQVSCSYCNLKGTISLDIPDVVNAGEVLSHVVKEEGTVPEGVVTTNVTYNDGTHDITTPPSEPGLYTASLTVSLGTTQKSISKNFRISCGEGNHFWECTETGDNAKSVEFTCARCRENGGKLELKDSRYCVGKTGAPDLTNTLDSSIELNECSWTYFISTDDPGSFETSTSTPTDIGSYKVQYFFSYISKVDMVPKTRRLVAQYEILPHNYDVTLNDNKSEAAFSCYGVNHELETAHDEGTVTLSANDTFVGMQARVAAALNGTAKDKNIYREPDGGFYSYVDSKNKPIDFTNAGSYYVKATLKYGNNNSVILQKPIKVHQWVVASNENGTARLKCSEGCEDVIGSIAINAENTGIESDFGNWGKFDIKNEKNEVFNSGDFKYYDVNGNQLPGAPTADGRYKVEAKITSPVEVTLTKLYQIGACHNGFTDIEEFPMGNGGEYHLTKDITLSNDIKVGGNITLCLDGHKIDVNGHKIIVLGDLTIRDCNTSKNTVTSAIDSQTEIEIIGGVITGGTSDKDRVSVFELNDKATLNLAVNVAGNKCSVVKTAAGSTANLKNAYITGNNISSVFTGTSGSVNLVDTTIAGNNTSDVSDTDGIVSVSGNTVVTNNFSGFKHNFKIKGALGNSAYIEIYRNEEALKVKVAEGENYIVSSDDLNRCIIADGSGYNQVLCENNEVYLNHKHKWTITADDTTYTQHCENSGANCKCCLDKKYEVLLDLQPRSDNKWLAEVAETNSDVKFDTKISEIKYRGVPEGEIPSRKDPSLDKETFTAEVSINSVDGNTYTLSKDVTLSYFDATATVTANNLTYTGDPQPLVTGTSDEGTIKYSLDGKNFSTDIPTGTNAGHYEVSYMVIGDNTHYNSDVFKIPVTIAKAQLTDSIVKVTGKSGLKYTGEAQALTDITGNLPGGCNIEYSTVAKGATPGTYSADGNKATDVGEYYVYYNISDGDNYLGTNGRVEVKIDKADIPVTVKGKTGLKDNGTEQELTSVTGTMPDGLVMEYSTVAKGATPGIYTENGNKKKDAGEYTVYYKVNGGNNYNNINSSVDVTIAKKSDEGGGGGGGGGVLPPAEPTAVEAVTGLVYTGEAQKLVKGGDKDTLYSLDGVTFTAAIPTGTDAGEYTVTYKQSSKTETVKVTIKKADVKLAEAPLASSITSEKKLSASVISGGSVLFGDKPVEGTFAWETPDVVPGVSGEYTCIFTPSTGNFNTVTCKVKVTVKEGKAYPITLEKTGKGTVTISDYEPVKGDEVTVKLAPSTGYLIKSVKFTYSSGRAVPDQYLEKVSSKKYILTQPARRVTITVVFAKDPTYVSEKTMSKNSITLNNDFTVLEADYGYDVTWGKVKGADGYIVSTNYCGSKLTTKCRTYVKSGSKTSVYIDKIKGVNYNMKKNVRVYVRAYKLVGTKKITIGKTFTAHMAAPLSETYTNVKELRTNESELNLKKGKTAAITVSRTILYDQDKKELTKSHSAQRHYYTTNASVATVSSEGIVTAKGTGTCDVYVRAQNGVKKKVTINVQ